MTDSRAAKAASFTPGPFTAVEQIGLPNHCCIAQVFGPDGGVVADIYPTTDPKVASATAVLFAAAPDLYAALIELWGYGVLIQSENDDDYDDDYALKLSRARVALAKATGAA